MNPTLSDLMSDVSTSSIMSDLVRLCPHLENFTARYDLPGRAQVAYRLIPPRALLAFAESVQIYVDNGIDRSSCSSLTLYTLLTYFSLACKLCAISY